MKKDTNSGGVVTRIPEPILSTFVFGDVRTSWFWLLVRLYVGWQWLDAGWEKVSSAAWVGPTAGGALKGFLAGALKKTAGAHPDVSSWYGDWLKNVVMPHAATFSWLVAYGEVLVGIALILGLFTGIAAFFGAFMNMNYLFAGAVSTNPLLFILELFLILAWRVAGFLGLDYWVLRWLGTPWSPGDVFKKK
ncbi:DoxX family protein [Patescibacteria group bacterium]|nr:DoxX family protein [Patescibacteria group bacterium]